MTDPVNKNALSPLRSIKWMFNNPAKMTGWTAVPGDLLMLGTGILTGNPALATAGTFLTTGDAALLLYGDPKSSQKNIDDPQDHKVGLKRFYAFRKYPHEFAVAYVTGGIATLIAAGVQIAGPEIPGLPFLNYVGETARTFVDIPLGSNHVIGIDGKSLTGLICLPGTALISFVQEKSPEQIEEKKRQRLARAGNPETAIERIGHSIRSTFNKAGDFIQQNVPLTAALIFQCSLIPYAIDGYLQPNASETLSMLGSTAMFFLTNSFYALSSKRVKYVPELSLSPVPQ